MDCYGAAIIVSGVILVVFAIAESAYAEKGWRTPYVSSLFVIGCLSLLLAVYIEVWVAELPLLPADVFAVPSMTPLVLSLLLLYGTWGVFSLYGTQYFQNIMAWYVPLGVAGLLPSTVEGFVLYLIPGRALIIISGFGAVGSQLLLALISEGGNYWAWIFPATVLSTVGIDLSTNLMTVLLRLTFQSRDKALLGDHQLRRRGTVPRLYGYHEILHRRGSWSTPKL